MTWYVVFKSRIEFDIVGTVHRGFGMQYVMLDNVVFLDASFVWFCDSSHQ